jgi:hypothetical protein
MRFCVASRRSRNPVREEIHRRRFASVLIRCPKLTRAWFHAAPVNVAAFSPDGRRVITAGDTAPGRQPGSLRGLQPGWPAGGDGKRGPNRSGVGCGHGPAGRPAHAHLRHPAEAERCLNRGLRSSERALRAGPAAGTPNGWQARLEFQLLRREAEALIGRMPVKVDR